MKAGPKDQCFSPWCKTLANPSPTVQALFHTNTTAGKTEVGDSKLLMGRKG
jgi:hypothetical protein